MSTSLNFPEGEVLAIDKALEWTSFDVVNKLRYELRNRLHIKKIKVGHAGTLDPLATGLLLICTGKMTKQINTFQDLEKEYTGTFTLGATTPSFDLETEIDNTFSTDDVTEEKVKAATQQFTGEIDQRPPGFSAIKVKGKRAYELARQGIETELESRRIRISAFDVSLEAGNIVKFRIVCSKGTYIRSMARDLGEALGCGAYLSELRRTRIGNYSVDKAYTLEEMIQLIPET